MLVPAMEPRLVTRWEAAKWAREAYTIGARFYFLSEFLFGQYTIGARFFFIKIFGQIHPYILKASLVTPKIPQKN